MNPLKLAACFQLNKKISYSQLALKPSLVQPFLLFPQSFYFFPENFLWFQYFLLLLRHVYVVMTRNVLLKVSYELPVVFFTNFTKSNIYAILILFLEPILKKRLYQPVAFKFLLHQLNIIKKYVYIK